MPATVGLFVEREHDADFLWNQCDGVLGRHQHLELCNSDRNADHILAIGTPIPVHAGHGAKPRRWERRLARMTGSLTTLRAQTVWQWLNREPGDLTCLFYEPGPIVSDELYTIARQYAGRVYGPDDRATHPIRLPSMWTLTEPIDWLRNAPKPDRSDKPLKLACVSSGKAMIAGHEERLRFFGLLRERGLGIGGGAGEFRMYGRGLPGDLGSKGQVISKGSVLRPAMFTLAIENYAEGDRYVTEKLWDPLLCWSVPLYYGSRAADAMIPSDAFIRLPNLGPRGVEVVAEAIADETNWSRRLDAIAEARTLAMSKLRLTEWLARDVIEA